MSRRAPMVAWVSLCVMGCVRPSDRYDVDIHGAGTPIDDVLDAPSPMGGLIEMARVSFWGSNLGHGLVGPFSDQPRADGSSIVIGNGSFGYPRDVAFDRGSTVLSPGPRLGPNEDGCVVRTDIAFFPWVSEYVDVGDAIDFTAADGHVLSLARDPARFPQPAGEAWYVGYGGTLGPALEGSDFAPDTWRSDASMSVSFPGGFPPDSATVGSIPLPMMPATVRTPEVLKGLEIGGVAVRPPHHGYDDDGVWWGDDYEDPVRFEGPWNAPMELRWTAGQRGDSLTLVVRLLGYGAESDCACGEDCGPGFACEQGVCSPLEGTGWYSVGELACSIADDGEFTLDPSVVSALLESGPAWERAGAVLAIGRMVEGEVAVPDVRSNAGRRIPVSPVRTRMTDIIWTRLEAP